MIVSSFVTPSKIARVTAAAGSTVKPSRNGGATIDPASI